MQKIVNKAVSINISKKFVMRNIREILKKKFVRSVFVVASGTFLAQAINMIFAPVITRLYGPEAFGILGVFTSMVAIVTPIAALTYPIAIVLPKEDSDAKGLIRLSLYIAVAMSLIMTLIMIFFGELIVKSLQVEVLDPYLLFIPLVMLFVAGVDVMQQWLIRKKQFKVRAKVDIAQAILVNGTKSGIGLFYPIATTLIFITTVGHALHALLLLWGTRTVNSNREIQHYNSNISLGNLAKCHRDFPIYRAPQVFIDGLSQSMPILMLTAFFGPAVAGFYAIGKKVLGLPSQLIGRAVGDVFYPRVTEAAHKNESISKLLIKSTILLSVIGLLPFGLIIALGPFLFSFVFGADWIVAGEYARWIALWSYFSFINKPSIKTLPVLEAQRFYLLFTICSISVRFCALAVGGYIFYSDLIAVVLYSISGALINIALIIVTIAKGRAFDVRTSK